MEAQVCDVCRTIMREGDYGEARWICTNKSCEKNDPSWPQNRLRQKLKPLNDEIERVSIFSHGIIEMYTVRWIGDGSFEVRFDSGRNIECYVEGNQVFPDIPDIDQEIRNKFKGLIALREKLFAKMNER